MRARSPRKIRREPENVATCEGQTVPPCWPDIVSFLYRCLTGGVVMNKDDDACAGQQKLPLNGKGVEDGRHLSVQQK